MTSPSSYLDKLRVTLHEYPIPPEASILVAFSGGPDSTALLFGLAELIPAYKLHLSAFHLNHGLRPVAELAAEESLIKKHCRNLGIPLYSHSLPRGKLAESAAESGVSLEAAAREIRYRLLEETAEKHNIIYIATGHTRDDNLETLIMRVFQGSGPGGLRGIPGKRGKLIRPLRQISKKENLNFLRSRKLAYSLDSTNTECGFLRNTLRHRLLPAIEEVFPGYRRGLETFACKMADIHHYLDQSLADKIRCEPCADGGFRLPCGDFNNLHRSLKLHLIYDLYSKISGITEKQLSFRFLKPVINTEFKKNSHFKGNGLVIFVKEDYLFFKADIVYPEKKGYLIEHNGTSGLIMRNSGFFLKLTEKHGAVETKNSCHETIILTKDLIRLPLVIRSRRAGDKIKLKTFSKSLKKLWAEWGVEERVKSLIPVIADRNGILAVAGKPFGYKNIVTPAHSITKKNEKIILVKIEEDGVKQSG